MDLLYNELYNKIALKRPLFEKMRDTLSTRYFYPGNSTLIFFHALLIPALNHSRGQKHLKKQRILIKKKSTVFEHGVASFFRTQVSRNTANGNCFDKNNRPTSRRKIFLALIVFVRAVGRLFWSKKSLYAPEQDFLGLESLRAARRKIFSIEKTFVRCAGRFICFLELSSGAKEIVFRVNSLARGSGEINFGVLVYGGAFLRIPWRCSRE